jgi:hypothetical protein
MAGARGVGDWRIGVGSAASGDNVSAIRAALRRRLAVKGDSWVREEVEEALASDSEGEELPCIQLAVWSVHRADF